MILNPKNLSFITLLFFLVVCSQVQANGCQDVTLRNKVSEVAQAEGVSENELLSVIAHESACQYYVIAWNIPKQPQTAQSQFFKSIQEAKAFAENLITSGQYRVDVGIGQINNEAHIQPRGWTLDEVLDPATALHRVAIVLKERGWANYHSSNPIYARRWQALALAALDRALSKTSEESKSGFLNSTRFLQAQAPRKLGELIIFNSRQVSEAVPLDDRPIEPVKLKALPMESSTIVSNSGLVLNTAAKASKDAPWIVYGSL